MVSIFHIGDTVIVSVGFVCAHKVFYDPLRPSLEAFEYRYGTYI
jgi:hypothetical protein